MISRRTFTLAAVGALVAAGLASVPPTATAASRRTVPRTAATWTGHAQRIGPADSAATASFRVYLAPRGGLAALEQEVAALSDPSSPSYRHFLSAGQYHARYDAPASAVSAVSSWLQGSRLRVTAVEPHHRYLSVRGTVASVQRALGVSLDRYLRHGQSVRANDRPVTVPAAIAPYVATVTGLDTTPHRIRHHAQSSSLPFPDGFRNARPCSDNYGDTLATTQADGKTPLPAFEGATLPYSVCGYTGPQLRTAYEGNSDLTGDGVTVAITDAYAAPTIASDAETYAKKHDDGSYSSGQLEQILPDHFTDEQLCDATGWWGEETLDIEAVHAMAPDAKIRYYASASCFDTDFLAALAKVVDDDQASLVSNSWSDLEVNETPDVTAAYEQIFLQGAVQGIAFLFSSGDDGDQAAGGQGPQVGYPSSDPYATAVGGTADAIDKHGFVFQTGWGTHKWSLSPDGASWTDNGFLYGAGGGLSTLFGRPSYQRGVVHGHGTTRAVPDVGLDADPTTGFLVGQTQRFGHHNRYDEYRIGGTSLASPMFAGLTALTQQDAGGRLGFLNPLIYRNAATFTDIVGGAPDRGNVRVDFVNGVDDSDGLLYTVRTFDEDSSLRTTPGWDNVTGVGSPNSTWLKVVPPGG